MDADLFTIRKMKQGDDAAFDAFVRKYYGDILKYCTFHCADRKEAEDLTQETFVRFFAKLSEYRYQGKTKNYLYTIAANLCRNHYKKRRQCPRHGSAHGGRRRCAGRRSSDEHTSAVGVGAGPACARAA